MPYVEYSIYRNRNDILVAQIDTNAAPRLRKMGCLYRRSNKWRHWPLVQEATMDQFVNGGTHEFLDGFPLWYLPQGGPGNILRLPIAHLDPGTYVLRVEAHEMPQHVRPSEEGKAVTLFRCDYEWPVELARRVIIIPGHPPDCKMVNTPPVKVLMEVSFNRQQYHSTDAFFTFHDRAYYTDHFHPHLTGKACDPADPRNTFSFWPDNGPLSGGILVTVAGIPIDPSVPPPRSRWPRVYRFKSPSCIGVTASMDPMAGPTVGGTTVLFKGLNLRVIQGQPLTCRFGGVYVPARVIKRPPSAESEEAGTAKETRGKKKKARENNVECLVDVECVSPPFAFEDPTSGGDPAARQGPLTRVNVSVTGWLPGVHTDFQEGISSGGGAGSFKKRAPHEFDLTKEHSFQFDYMVPGQPVKLFLEIQVGVVLSNKPVRGVF